MGEREGESERERGHNSKIQTFKNLVFYLEIYLNIQNLIVEWKNEFNNMFLEFFGTCWGIFTVTPIPPLKLTLSTAKLFL